MHNSLQSMEPTEPRHEGKKPLRDLAKRTSFFLLLFFSKNKVMYQHYLWSEHKGHTTELYFTQQQ